MKHQGLVLDSVKEGSQGDFQIFGLRDKELLSPILQAGWCILEGRHHNCKELN